jgi:ssRNA-specific RNase YbeY (16S rRNA maturation enzyme)
MRWNPKGGRRHLPEYSQKHFPRRKEFGPWETKTPKEIWKKIRLVLKKTDVFSDADVEVMITEDKKIDEIRQKLRVPEIN